ncbi:glycerol kinase GlpK [Iamia sp. SCSIO 61187]|uniref:glycerol kinase GlpK n=1 Tax=Iamia sp. SCSIO 61187 TaxID=2722752 RepID=UPI002104BC93|nr:glycerol kinase GlpK [Iamia sp. SCSIO 61187]QYG92769.1 glycerol kinase GlpK [Iamia sp. SCSIO 61187]
MAVVIALDAGTTGVRAFAVDEAGAPVGYRYQEFTQHFPRPGWVEHDATEIWTSVVAVTNRLITDLEQPVAAIGITDQRETVVAWSRRTGRPYHRAIVWQDRRTAARCDALAADGALATVRPATGLVLDPYFSASKAEWLLTEGGVPAGPDLCIGTIDAWLLWNLTGGNVFATEPSNASRTMLYDIRTLEWSDELCDLFSVPRSALPEVLPSSGRFGKTVGDTGLPSGIPISGIAGDQQAALFGQACFSPGMTKNTYGTGSFVLMNVGPTCPDPVEGLLTTVAWTLGGTASEPPRTDYAYEGAIFSTGSAVQWLRDGLGLIGEAAEVGPLAETVDSTDGVYLVPAFTGLGSPWWDPYARGLLVGFTRGTTRAHVARAVVEAMAFQTRDVVDAMSAASGHPVAELRADGGASAADLLLRLQADQLGVPVTRAAVPETTALGAAYLAGLAEGLWGSTAELAELWAGDEPVAPAADRTTADASHARWLEAVARSRAWEPPD